MLSSDARILLLRCIRYCASSQKGTNTTGAGPCYIQNFLSTQQRTLSTANCTSSGQSLQSGLPRHSAQFLWCLTQSCGNATKGQVPLLSRTVQGSFWEGTRHLQPRQLHTRPASTKPAPSSAKGTRSKAGVRDGAHSAKKEPLADLVHPLFAKQKGSKGDQAAKTGAAPLLSPQEAGRKPSKAVQHAAKPSNRRNRREQTAEAGSRPAVNASTQKQAQQAAPVVAEATSTPVVKENLAIQGQYSKLSKERGPRQQVPFAPTAMKLRSAPISPDAVADPYRGALPAIPWLDYLSIKGWSERRQRILNWARSLYATATIRRKLGLKAADFKEAAIELYYRVNMALSKSDLTGLRQMTAPQEMSRMKSQMKLRSDLGWKQMKWSIAKELQPKDVEIVQARVLAIQPDHDAFTFAQLTVKISAEIKFAAYNGEGKIVKGNPHKSVKTTDFWVLERAFTKTPTVKWRLASQLSNIAEPKRTGLLRRLFF